MKFKMKPSFWITHLHMLALCANHDEEECVPTSQLGLVNQSATWTSNLWTLKRSA